MAPNLLPCPFCGSEAYGPIYASERAEDRCRRRTPYMIECPNCPNVVEAFGANPEEASARWNTRMSPTIPEGWTTQQILDHAG